MKNPNLKSQGSFFRKWAVLMAMGVALGAQAQTTPAPQPGICTRSCWGARAGSCATGLGSLTRAIVHHTAGPSDYTTDYETGKARMRSTQNYHMDTQGWCDIGYHFLVDAAGHIYEGRAGSMSSATTKRGAHDGCNDNSMGFTALGYFHTPYNHAATPALQNALSAVIAWRMPGGWSPYGSGSYCGVSVGTLDGHYKVKSTACPGTILINQLGNIRNNVGSRRSTQFSKPAVFDPATAIWHLRNSNTAGPVDNYFTFGVGTDIPVMGDWDGNGSVTPGVFRPSTAVWYLRNSNSSGGVDGSFAFGAPGDIPIVGDWNGDGYWTIGVFRPSTAQWLLRNSNSAGGVDVAFYFGATGDIPMPGDWDGNGTYTPGVFRPSNAAWYLKNANANGNPDAGFYFGAAWDTPIVGDWNGDGYTTVGVVRGPIRYLTNSNLNPTTDVVFEFGVAAHKHLVWR